MFIVFISLSMNDFPPIELKNSFECLSSDDGEASNDSANLPEAGGITAPRKRSRSTKARKGLVPRRLVLVLVSRMCCSLVIRVSLQLTV